MPLACPRCGTQNPDGNAYCQACGTPLTAPVAATVGAFAGPPPGMAPPPPNMAPPPPPPGYQAPYYTPAGPTVQMQRTPWALIVAVVLVVTVLMAGAGTALAIIGNRSSQQSPSGGGIADVVPTPTPGVTPSPVASPTATAPATGLQSNDGFTVNVPSGWSIDSQDSETMVFTDPNGEGSVTVSSGASIPTQTAQNNKDTVDSTLKSKYPDTRECAGTSPANGTFNGASGISWQICFTLTSGANSVPAAASLFAGANASGSVYYLVMVLTVDGNLNGYLGTAKPLITTVHWKLS
jgi:zinc-ribbon domain